MAIAQYASSTEAVGTTNEWSLINDSSTIATDTTDGVYQLWVDLNAMVAGDQLRIRIYEKVSATATQRIAHEAIFTGAQSQPLVVFPSLVLLHGWDMTALALAVASSTISIEWSIRQVA